MASPGGVPKIEDRGSWIEDRGSRIAKASFDPPSSILVPQTADAIGGFLYEPHHPAYVFLVVIGRLPGKKRQTAL
jgi:hypothetical protein